MKISCLATLLNATQWFLSVSSKIWMKRCDWMTKSISIPCTTSWNPDLLLNWLVSITCQPVIMDALAKYLISISAYLTPTLLYPPFCFSAINWLSIIQNDCTSDRFLSLFLAFAEIWAKSCLDAWLTAPSLNVFVLSCTLSTVVIVDVLIGFFSWLIISLCISKAAKYTYYM